MVHFLEKNGLLETASYWMCTHYPLNVNLSFNLQEHDGDLDLARAISHRFNKRRKICRPFGQLLQ